MITEEVAYASEAPDGATEGIATTTCTMPLQSRPIRRSRPCSDLIEDIQMPEEAEEINKTEVPSRSPVNTKRVSQLIELGDDNLAELRRVAGTVNVPSSPNRVPRRSSVLEDKNEVSYHPSTLQLYAPPRQRQEWGQQQILPRVNWGDLFFDLFYVAAAYNASNILVESPSGQGCLYFLATFLSVQYFWVQKMNFDARFVVADDIYHRVFELFGLAVLASVVLHIRPVSILGNAAHSSDMFALALSLTVSWLYHIWRSLELIATGQGQRNVIRSMAWRDVRLAALPLAFCLASTILAGNDYFKYENKASGGDYRYLAAAADGIKANGDNITAIPGDTMYLNDNSSSSNLAIWLILFATIAHYSIFFLQVVFLFPNDGSHKNFVVPLNVDFSIHRFAEWTMLMLGESILSLLIVDVPAEDTGYFTTFYCSLLTVIFLQYLHFRSMPHNADDHAMRRSKNRGMVWGLMKYTYSCALIALGAAFTLFIMSFASDEINEASDAYGERRLAATNNGSKSLHELQQLEQHAANLFCLALALIYFTLDVMSLMNVGLESAWGRCRCQRNHAYNITGIALVFLRVGLIVFCATLGQWRTDPQVLAGVGLGVTISQMILRKLGEKYLNKGLEAETEERNAGVDEDSM